MAVLCDVGEPKRFAIWQRMSYAKRKDVVPRLNIKVLNLVIQYPLDTARLNAP